MEGAIKSALSPLLLIILLFFTSSGKLTSAASSPTDFIRTSCSATSYPDVCVQSLTTYAPSVRRSPRQLANAALTVSANRAREASTYISHLSSTTAGGKSVRSRGGAGAFQDCIRTMADSADRLRRSVSEMVRLGRAASSGFAWHMSNVQTWFSAALTDQNTCLDSLSQDGAGASVGATIRKKVVGVSQVTSNALSLVNRIGSRN